MMDAFLGQVEKHMILLKKKNMNTFNEFKIEMFQIRKNIDKNNIKLEFAMTESHYADKNTSVLQHEHRKDNKNLSSKNLSTNYNSRAIDENIGQGCQISKFTSHSNKENQDPNPKIKTDISVIQEFPIKNDFLQKLSQEEMYKELYLLKDDESFEIGTEQVRKKYQKFKSHSAGWTLSADPFRQNTSQLNSHFDPHPFCTQFAHQREDQLENQGIDLQENQSILENQKYFGFERIQNGKFSRTNTIQQLEEYAQSNQSQTF